MDWKIVRYSKQDCYHIADFATLAEAEEALPRYKRKYPRAKVIIQKGDTPSVLAGILSGWMW
jgi:hypothetical protein